MHDTSVAGRERIEPVDYRPTGSWLIDAPSSPLNRAPWSSVGDALVRAALEQFAVEGFENVNIEDIVSACDVSPRTFFRYFSTKEDVLFADADEKRRNLVEILEAQPDDIPPLRALQVAISTLCGEYEDQRELLLLRHRTITTTPALRGRQAERTHSWESTVVDEMRRTGRAGPMSDLDLRLLVAVAVTALRVSTEQWINDENPADLRTLVDSTFDKIRRGLEG
ncbi:MAG: TetR family transcriptional regulator [Acidimicrobiales bacterium]